MVEVCSKCGWHFDTALARGTHEGKCKAVGVGLAEGHDRVANAAKSWQSVVSARVKKRAEGMLSLIASVSMKLKT